MTGRKKKDHGLEARCIKISDYHTNLGDHKHQFYWKFVAFPYISNTKVTIYNAYGASKDGKINGRPEKLYWLFITKGY